MFVSCAGVIFILTVSICALLPYGE